MMKKSVILLVFCCFFFSGCGKTDPNYETYQQLVNDLSTSTDFLLESDRFQMELSFLEVTEDEIQYRFVLDEVTVPMNQIVALLIHEQEEEDMFPSVGIFEEAIDLSPGGVPKGIILVGYLPIIDDVSSYHFRLFLSYTLEDGTFHQEIYQL